MRLSTDSIISANLVFFPSLSPLPELHFNERPKRWKDGARDLCAVDDYRALEIFVASAKSRHRSQHLCTFAFSGENFINARANWNVPGRRSFVIIKASLLLCGDCEQKSVHEGLNAAQTKSAMFIVVRCLLCHWVFAYMHLCPRYSRSHRSSSS